MDKLLEAIFDLVSNTPPEKIEQLAGLLRNSDSSSAHERLNAWALTPVAQERVLVLASAWKITNIPSEELAGMLIGANHTYRQVRAESDIELVWTGPSSELVATRKTEQALLQVIDAAKRKFFLTSFVAYDVASIMSALSSASERGVEISMLLESSDMHGGGISIDAIGNMKKALPTSRIYFWSNKTGQFAGGKVHAKVAVSDEAICFLSSANLTGYAMEKNMEAGVLVRGGAIPRKLHRHLDALVTTKLLKRA